MQRFLSSLVWSVSNVRSWKWDLTQRSISFLFSFLTMGSLVACLVWRASPPPLLPLFWSVCLVLPCDHTSKSHWSSTTRQKRKSFLTHFLPYLERRRKEIFSGRERQTEGKVREREKRRKEGSNILLTGASSLSHDLFDETESQWWEEKQKRGEREREIVSSHTDASFR